MNNCNEPIFRHNDYRRFIQIRAMDENTEDDYWELEGKAVAFNEATTLFSIGNTEYKEIISDRAFDKADCTDVFLKFNHENSWIACARTKNGTLEIDVRPDGVYIKAKLQKNLRWCEDLYKAVKAGLIDKMSFAFSIADEGEEYDEAGHCWTVRNIEKVYDVAAVEVPAYDNTFIFARRKGEVEARLKEVETSRLERARMIALTKLKTENNGGN